MKAFDAFYYSFNPIVAPVVASSQPMAIAVRLFLCPLLGILQASSVIFNAFSFAPEVGIAVTGVFTSALLGLTYVAPTALGIRYLLRKGSVRRSVTSSLTKLSEGRRSRPPAGVSQ